MTSSRSRAIDFTVPTLVGAERAYLEEVLNQGRLSGDGPFTRRCQDWLLRRIGGVAALLTHSCTAALEMAVILAGVGPGDEVILPSFTFVSTANAVALRNAVPVFVDVRPDTMNIDETRIEAAITPKTKAIIAVHYAGVPADMDAITAIARAHGLIVIEDAAQALLSTYRGRPAGTLGDLACFSFHETKNVISGEGGALIVNRSELEERAHIIWEKGTNRRKFILGMTDKYTWVDLGSSFLPSELVAGFLLAQLEAADKITERRRSIFSSYYENFAALAMAGLVRRPMIPTECTANGHLFYLILNTAERRDALIAHLLGESIAAPFHYVPLHSSPAGRRLGRATGSMPVTDDLSRRLIRLPLHPGLGEALSLVVGEVHRFFGWNATPTDVREHPEV